MTDEIRRSRDWYGKAGWRIFPVVGKVPVPGMRWKNLEPTEEQWALATGLAYIVPEGTCVVDIDMHANKQKCADDPESCSCEDPETLADKIGRSTVEASTPSGGLHLYFREPTGYLACSAKKIHPQVDIKSQGNGYVVLPPSLSEAGVAYRWISPPGTSELPRVPDVIQKASVRYAETRAKVDHGELFRNGAPKGQRHPSAAILAGTAWNFLAKKPDDFTAENLEVVETLLRFWNRNNVPPVEEKDIIRVSADIGKKHYDGVVARWNAELARR